MRRSFKYRIYPSKIQLAILDQMLTGARNLYNAALEQRKSAWVSQRRPINYNYQAAELKDARDADAQLGLVNCSACQAMLRRLQEAFDAFFRRIKAGETPGYPRFKTADRFKSITFPSYGNGIKLTDKLYIQSVGRVRIKLHRPVDGRIKTATIRRESSHWYVIFSCDDVQAREFPIVTAEIGIDVGLKIFAGLSTGEKVKNPRWYRKIESKLVYAQQELSRKQRHSKRRTKAKARVGRLHTKTRNQRLDFHHKLAHKLVSENAMISVEDLEVTKLIETSRTGMTKSIHDAAWTGFLIILGAKAEEAGRKFVKVPPRGTTSTCSQCGAFKKKTLNERMHNCPCGLILDRDINASLNILRLGRSLQVCTS